MNNGAAMHTETRKPSSPRKLLLTPASMVTTNGATQLVDVALHPMANETLPEGLRINLARRFVTFGTETTHDGTRLGSGQIGRYSARAKATGP